MRATRVNSLLTSSKDKVVLGERIRQACGLRVLFIVNKFDVTFTLFAVYCHYILHFVHSHVCSSIVR